MADEEELVDYEDDHEEITGGSVAVATGTNGKVAEADVDGTKKGSYVGIHSTGFR